MQRFHRPSVPLAHLVHLSKDTNSTTQLREGLWAVTYKAEGCRGRGERKAVQAEAWAVPRCSENMGGICSTVPATFNLNGAA